MPQRTNLVFNSTVYVLIIARAIVLAEDLNFKTEARNISKRIINGHRVGQGEFQEYVSLRVKFSPGNSSSNLCGGVLLDRDVVLTAAHCVKGAVNVEVASGIYSPSYWDLFGVETYIAFRVCLPREQELNDDRQDRNDFAILTLEKPIPNARVAVLETNKIEPGRRGTAIGLGKIRFDRENKTKSIDPSMLHKISMKSVECKPDDKHISHVCFSGLDPNDFGGPCFGDSGGPIFSEGKNRTVLGIVSYTRSREPCHPKVNSQSVYTNVSNLRGRIHLTARECRYRIVLSQ